MWSQPGLHTSFYINYVLCSLSVYELLPEDQNIWHLITRNTRKRQDQPRPNTMRQQISPNMSRSCYLHNNQLPNPRGRHKFLAVVQYLQMKLPKCPSIFTREIWTVVPHHLHSRCASTIPFDCCQIISERRTIRIRVAHPKFLDSLWS